MRTTVVPAQITSVEDKIAGNLSFTQLLLMIVPIFISAGLFVFLPPFTAFKVYKLAIASIIAIVCMSLAIRIRGKLVIEWLVIRGRYNLRPQFYVFNKNVMAGRKMAKVEIKESSIKEIIEELEPAKLRPAFKVKEILAFDTAVNHPDADFHLRRSKKGGLNVRIKEM